MDYKAAERITIKLCHQTATPNSLRYPRLAGNAVVQAETALYITMVTRIRLLSCLAETICADPCTPARDHIVVCGNKTIPVCRTEVMRAGVLGAVWIFYNGLLMRRSRLSFSHPAYQASANFAYMFASSRMEQIAVYSVSRIVSAVRRISGIFLNSPR